MATTSRDIFGFTLWSISKPSPISNTGSNDAIGTTKLPSNKGITFSVFISGRGSIILVVPVNNYIIASR